MEDIPNRTRQIHAWSLDHYRQHPDAPDVFLKGESDPKAREDLAPLLAPGMTVCLSPGATYVFHLRAVLLARGIGQRLPQASLRWQRDPEIQDLLARAGDTETKEDILLANTPDVTAHQRVYIASLLPPERALGTVLLRRPGIIGLIGIEAQQICLLALRLHDPLPGHLAP